MGIRDGYFALGGDSIRSIAVRSRAREQGIEFSLQELFEKQTIEALAALPSAPAEAVPGPSPEPFSLLGAEDRARLPDGLTDAYPATRLQIGMLFHAHDSGGALDQDMFSHHLRGTLDLAALQSELDAAIARHPVLRTSFDLAGYSEPMQLVHGRADCPIAYADFSDLPPAEQERLLDRHVEAEDFFPSAGAGRP